jgi:DNA-binding MarR family transcriptional regulator
MVPTESFRSTPHVLGDITLMGRLAQDRIGSLLGACELTHAQAVLLVRLWRAPASSLSQTTLIESLAVSRASGTQLLHDLEDRGLVVRSPDPFDARRQWVSLTAKGHDQEGRVFGIFEQVEEEIVGIVDDEQRRILATTLAAMLDRAREGRRRDQ